MNAVTTAPPHRVGVMPTDQKPQPSPAKQTRAKPDQFDPSLKALQKKLLALGPKDFLGVVGVNMRTVRKLIPLVVNGIAFCEFQHLDWKSAVSASLFDMGCPNCCLFARMASGDFWKACRMYGLDPKTDGVRLGIYLSLRLASVANYDALTHLWIHAAKLRG